MIYIFLLQFLIKHIYSIQTLNIYVTGGNIFYKTAHVEVDAVDVVY